VIAIIGVLVALLLPAVQAAREAARRSQCVNNFKQVGITLHNYLDAKKKFPPGMIYNTNWSSACGTKPLASANLINGFPVDYSWSVLILPFLEEQAMADAYDYSIGAAGTPAVADNNYRNSGKPIKVYQCPSDPQAGELVSCCGSKTNGTVEKEDLQHTSMCAVSDTDDYMCANPVPKWFSATASNAVTQRFANGAFGNFDGARGKHFSDGLSKTLFVGEVLGEGQGSFSGHFWAMHNLLDTYDGINGSTTVVGGSWPALSYRGTGFASMHPGGCHFLKGDASATFYSEDISQSVLDALTTRAGGETVTE